jgi:hypothetical protein
MDSRPIETPRISPPKWKQRLFTVGFLTASVVAMLGWMTGIAWAALSLLKVLL